MTQKHRLFYISKHVHLEIFFSHDKEKRMDEAVIDYCAAHDKGVLIKKALGSGHFCHNPIQDSMEFIFSKKGVTSIIVGTINPQHLEENVSAIPPIF